MTKMAMPVPTSNATSDHQVDIADRIAMIVSITILCFIAILAIIGNSLNFMVIRRLTDVDMSDASKLLHRALSASDLTTGLALLVGTLSGLTSGWLEDGVAGPIFCRITGFVMTCGPGTSSALILLINFDRFIFISRPLTYTSDVTKRKAAIATIASVISVCVAILASSGIHSSDLSVFRYHQQIHTCKLAFSEPSFLPYTLTLFSLNMWIVTVLLLAMYGRILHISLKHAAQIRAHRAVAARVAAGQRCPLPAAAPNQERGAQHPPNRPPNQRREMLEIFRQSLRTLRTPLAITGCYLIAWIPFTVIETVIAVSKRTELLETYLYQILAALAAGNCSVNLFVYYIHRLDFRKALKRIIHRQ